MLPAALVSLWPDIANITVCLPIADSIRILELLDFWLEISNSAGQKC